MLADNQSVIAKSMSERTLQNNVIEMAERLGYLCYHTFDSRRSNKGFPDVVMVRGGRIIFVELKTQKGKVGPEQMTWLTALSHTPLNGPVQVHLFRPSNWLNGDIQSVLEAT